MSVDCAGSQKFGLGQMTSLRSDFENLTRFGIRDQTTETRHRDAPQLSLSFHHHPLLLPSSIHPPIHPPIFLIFRNQLAHYTPISELFFPLLDNTRGSYCVPPGWHTVRLHYMLSYSSSSVSTTTFLVKTNKMIRVQVITRERTRSCLKGMLYYFSIDRTDSE